MRGANKKTREGSFGKEKICPPHGTGLFFCVLPSRILLRDTPSKEPVRGVAHRPQPLPHQKKRKGGQPVSLGKEPLKEKGSIQKLTLIPSKPPSHRTLASQEVCDISSEYPFLCAGGIKKEHTSRIFCLYPVRYPFF